MSAVPPPPESPSLGFTHLQFEALLTPAHESPNGNDFALIVLGLLGPRIFEGTTADIDDLGEEYGYRVLTCGFAGCGEQICALTSCAPPGGAVAYRAHRLGLSTCGSGSIRAMPGVGLLRPG
jgi:hypothetical protein